MQDHRLFLYQRRGGFAYLRIELLAAILQALGSTPGAAFTAAFLHAEEDFRLVAVLALTAAAGTALLLAFLLLAQFTLATLALDTGAVQRLLRGLAFLLAAGLVEGVAAAVTAQAGCGQLDDTLHASQQFTVMADQHQAAAPARQALAKAPAAEQIEVVAGLVENQHVRLGQPCTEQGNAAAFTAAQLRGRCLRIEMAEAFVLQRACQPLGHIPAAIENLDVVGMRLTAYDPLQGIEPLRTTSQVDDPVARRGNDALG